MLRIRRDARWERGHEPEIAAAIDDLLAFGALDGETLREALAARLGPLRDGLLASPHHRERLAARGLSPSDLQTLDDLRAFPTLDRATLAERWHDLAALSPDEDLVVVWSSGSTGTPVSVVRRAGESLHMWAVIAFLARRFGVDLPPRPRVVLLCALPDGVEYSARLPLLGDGALHRLSVRRPRTAERLARVRPAIVTGDPESLRWLSERPVTQPLLIVSSALHLAADLRAALPAPVADVYSTTETGPIAWACRAGSFHVLVPDVWVEELDGELVVTRLRPGALPLLRYRTGDRGSITFTPCGCGHRGPSVSGFVGRRACRFRTPAGAEVDAWQLAPLLRGLTLRDFRVTQETPADFLVEVSGEPPAELAATVVRGLESLGFTAPRARVQAGARLDHGAKPEPFRSAAGAR